MKTPIRLLLVVILLGTTQLAAQIKYSGKDFIFSLGGGTYNDSTLTFNDYNISHIELMSAHIATVHFFYKKTGITNTYHVLPYTPLIVKLTTSEVVAIVENLEDVVRNQTLEITADSDIAVTFEGGAGDKSSDAMSILPIDGQRRADSFLLLGMNTNEGGTNFPVPYTYNVVANCDSVTLEIIPRENTNHHARGVPFTVFMRRGQEFRIGTPSITGTMPLDNRDISGTSIKVLGAPCCYPISIFLTYPVLYMNWPLGPGTICCADVILEQVLPVNYWETFYPVVPYYNDSTTIVRVMSAANSNRIYIDHTLTTVLNRGDFLDTILYKDKPAIISSDLPIGVAQFMLSDDNDTARNNGDPDMLWCPSQAQGITDAVFKPFPRLVSLTGTTAPHSEVLAIISPAANAGAIQVNGAAIPTALFHPFPADASWQYAYVQLHMDSQYHVTSPRPIIAYHYEQETQGSYSHLLPDLQWAFSDSNGIVETDTVYLRTGRSAVLHDRTASQYHWNTGATTPSITVSIAGLFTVDERTDDGCTIVKIKHNFRVIVLDTLIRNTTIVKCKGFPVQLMATNAASYQWNTGDTTQRIVVASAGAYKVIEKANDTDLPVTVHRFYVRDTVYPGIDLGRDTVMCPGDSLTFAVPYRAAVWSTGDTGASITVGQPGRYYVRATDSCGNVKSDTVTIVSFDCIDRYCDVTFPTAFTPNFDGKNDIFRPTTHGLLTNYLLRVYNRWGNLVFSSNDPNVGWDGHDCDMAVYYYYCSLDCQGHMLLKGEITLVR